MPNASVTITAPSTAPWRDYTAGLPFYGSVIQNEIWIGNGTDANVAWAGGTLVVLGPAAAPTDPQDPSQAAFPPCKSWLPGSDGQVYGTGNASAPLKIWCGEIPSVNFPLNRGLKTLAYSFINLQVNATSITAISAFASDLIAHLNIGPPQIIKGYRGTAGGWKLNQDPTSANASAINPNCARDTKISQFYIGSDLEFYELPTYKGSITERGYDRSTWRDGQIVTKKSSGQWNDAARKPISGNDYFLIDDEKNGRTWAWLAMGVTTMQGVYCYEQRTGAITGPWRYPDFLVACQLRDENAVGTIVCGITRRGVFLWSDVAAIGDYALPSYLTALPSGCEELTVAPTPDHGIPYVGVTADGLGFKMVLGGQTISMATPWSDWAAEDIVCTKFYNNARVAVIEFAEGDCSLPAIQKEFVNARLILNRNSVIYAGVYVQANGYSYGGWRGLFYPSTDWLAAIGGEGSTYRMRIIAVTFNDQNAVLSGVNVDFLPSVEN